MSNSTNLKIRNHYTDIYGKERKNRVRFTPQQTQAILASQYSGIQLIIGPPGTGKTDTLVQIVNLLYHNFPDQRILLITRSNQALNDIFTKISHLNIDEKHLLRLGMGQKDLRLGKQFGKSGRIDYMLSRRIFVLQEALKIQDSLGAKYVTDFTCETAEKFYEILVLPYWEMFREKLSQFKGNELEAYVKQSFSFSRYIAELIGAPLEE